MGVDRRMAREAKVEFALPEYYSNYLVQYNVGKAYVSIVIVARYILII